MTTPPDLAIRMRRAAFNRALASADLDAIAALLAPAAVLVAGTDSEVVAGRNAQLRAWKGVFATRTLYTRTPDTIVVSPVEPIAFEHGRWEGVGSDGGVVLASGSYTAKWRETRGLWVIEAELYLTLA